MDTKCLKISSWETTIVHTPEIYFIKKEFDHIFFSNISFQFLGDSGYIYKKNIYLDISTALMRPRRPKQYCLQLKKKIYIYIYIYLQVDPSLITLYIVYAILILLAGLLQVIFPSRFLN